MLIKLRRVVRDRLARRLGLPEIPFALERLQANNFEPKLIFDVGAYSGEFARQCRQTWPAASIICFEVLPQRVRVLKDWCAADGNSHLMNCLLGAEEKEAVPLHEMETASSILEEHHLVQAARVNTYQMKSVDSVLAAKKWTPPDLLKLDVQGYELEVLKGAERALAHVAVLLAEINLIDIHKGAPLLDEFVMFVRQHGFVAYDICGLTRRPLDQALWQADFVFVKAGSPFRADKRWLGK